MKDANGSPKKWLILILLTLMVVNPGCVNLPKPKSAQASAAPVDAPRDDVEHRYVDASQADSGDGLSWATAWQTLSEAAQAPLAPGTIVHIAPGIYRETLAPQQGGTAGAPITYRAEEGPDTVFILGSETSTTLGETWLPLSSYAPGLSLQAGVDPTDVYFIDADWDWEMDWDPGYGTTFPIESDLIALVSLVDGLPDAITRLTQAREPDWTVDDVDRHHANWWTADGGAANLGASSPSDSNVFLMDTASDHTRDQDGDGQPDFPNIQPGSLQSLFTSDDAFWDPRADAYPGDVIRQNPLQPTLLFNDGRSGHYTPLFNILDYNSAAGVAALDNPRPTEGPDGEGHYITEVTKFYVQGAPLAMDCPGEWVHHDGKIFILTGDAGDAGCGVSLNQSDLVDLEIARRFSMIQVTDLSHLHFEDLNLSFNNHAKYGYYYGLGDDYPPYQNYPPGAIDITTQHTGVVDLVFDGLTVSHALSGLYAGYPDQASAFTLKNSTFIHIDGTALLVQGPDDSGWDGIRILNNHFEDLGFRPQIGEGVGLNISRVSDFLFKDNHMENVAHNGVQFHQGWGSYMSENILILNNTFDGACRMAYDCAGLKFHGGGKAYQDVLVMGNLSKNNIGWSYAAWVEHLAYRQSEPGGWWPFTVLGELGMGVYMDYASGVTVYRNVLIDNSVSGVYFTGNYREGQPNFVIHNTIASTLDGVHFGNSFNDLSHTDSRVLGNLFINCENSGVHYAASDGDDYSSPPDLTALNVAIDYNLYKPYPDPPDLTPWFGYDPDWYEPAVLEYLSPSNHWEPYLTLADVQAHTDWGDHGTEWQTGDPLFVHEDGESKADFALAQDSAAVDAGLPELPVMLTALMADLSMALDITLQDAVMVGAAYDAGAFEYAEGDWAIYLPVVMR
jgi:hypothetical protein